MKLYPQLNSPLSSPHHITHSPKFMTPLNFPNELFHDIRIYTPALSLSPSLEICNTKERGLLSFTSETSGPHIPQAHNARTDISLPRVINAYNERDEGNRCYVHIAHTEREASWKKSSATARLGIGFSRERKVVREIEGDRWEIFLISSWRNLIGRVAAEGDCVFARLQCKTGGARGFVLVGDAIYSGFGVCNVVQSRSCVICSLFNVS